MTCKQPKYIMNRYIPCGGCTACKIQIVKEWSLRLEDEARYHKEKCVLLLTYNNEHLPQNGSLNRHDVTLFLKRLRKTADEIDKKIKYFYSAEYGEKDGRPHYHMVLYGYMPDDMVYLRKTKKGTMLFASRELDKIWGKGYVTVSHMDAEAAKYVCKYLHKVYYKNKIQKEYGLKEPTTRRCSQGLGKKYIENNIDKLINDKKIKGNGWNRSLPRYYIKKIREHLNDETWLMNEDVIKYGEQMERVAKPSNHSMWLEAKEKNT